MTELKVFTEAELSRDVRLELAGMMAPVWPDYWPTAWWRMRPALRVVAFGSDGLPVGQQAVFHLTPLNSNGLKVRGLGALFVKRWYRGMGVGRELIQAGVTCAGGQVLLTSTRAPEVQRVIVGLGFTPLREGAVTWGDGESRDSFWVRAQGPYPVPLVLEDGRF